MLAHLQLRPHVHWHRDREEVAPPVRPYFFPENRLAPYVDLRAWMTPVQDQEETNAWYEQ